MKSPWFILELQCYDPSALAPTPLDKMDKVDYLPLSLSPFFFFYLSQGNQCLSLLCLLCRWTVGNAALSMFFFSPLSASYPVVSVR